MWTSTLRFLNFSLKMSARSESCRQLNFNIIYMYIYRLSSMLPLWLASTCCHCWIKTQPLLFSKLIFPPFALGFCFETYIFGIKRYGLDIKYEADTMKRVLFYNMGSTSTTGAGPNKPVYIVHSRVSFVNRKQAFDSFKLVALVSLVEFSSYQKFVSKKVSGLTSFSLQFVT